MAAIHNKEEVITHLKVNRDSIRMVTTVNKVL